MHYNTNSRTPPKCTQYKDKIIIGGIKMSLFKTQEEVEEKNRIAEEKKRRAEDEFIAEQGCDCFCYAFTDIVRDVHDLIPQVNAFLKRHPNFRVGSMTYAPGLSGTCSLVCYFEHK